MRDTKQRMLAATASLLHRQGYASTGLNQILEESKAPRGSMYFHFPGGKEELVAQALAGAADEITGLLERLLAAAPDARTALDMIVGYFRGQLEQSKFQKGCPIATVALEQAATSDPLQGACAAAYRRWAHLIAMRLEAEGLVEDRAASLANLCLSAIEGALVLSRAHRSVDPLLRAGAELRELLPSKRKDRR